MGHANCAGRVPGWGSDDGEIMIWDPPSNFVSRRIRIRRVSSVKKPLTGLPAAAPYDSRSWSHSVTSKMAVYPKSPPAQA
jgi:hypothetical protein